VYAAQQPESNGFKILPIVIAVVKAEGLAAEKGG